VDSSGPDYLNAVVEVQTSLGPYELLSELQRLEQEAGRERPYHNAPRTLDLDLLIYGELRQDDPFLTLPHPRMMERAFVLLPLAEIAPTRVSPMQLQKVEEQPISRWASL
jgi:2-amino-4-hydroxy-6-hydroxymethyldihydropteridine diphosphokinase